MLLSYLSDPYPSVLRRFHVLNVPHLGPSSYISTRPKPRFTKNGLIRDFFLLILATTSCRHLVLISTMSSPPQQEGPAGSPAKQQEAPANSPAKQKESPPHDTPSPPAAAASQSPTRSEAGSDHAPIEVVRYLYLHNIGNS